MKLLNKKTFDTDNKVSMTLEIYEIDITENARNRGWKEGRLIIKYYTNSEGETTIRKEYKNITEYSSHTYRTIYL